MNHNQQSNEVRHDDESALSDFLASLADYTPTIPDELVEHYLAKSGFQCPDVRLTRLVAVAAQKFVSDIAIDALQHCKARQATVVRDKKTSSKGNKPTNLGAGKRDRQGLKESFSNQGDRKAVACRVGDQ
ncbi:hypothetical protein E3N88_13245 [Mikania micrantha]|uniref:Transcription initiation factor TFIID subunit 10 n=1 Tax=Mikania micrantha TaxID=192012 RepID=A0A5N6PAQ7_9ASTR|nr:hypothetical protein E3N88_13245 [Mikania micrantha]